MPIYFLLSIWVLLSVGSEPTPQAYFERGALFYNALTSRRFPETTSCSCPVPPKAFSAKAEMTGERSCHDLLVSICCRENREFENNVSFFLLVLRLSSESIWICTFVAGLKTPYICIDLPRSRDYFEPIPPLSVRSLAKEHRICVFPDWLPWAQAAQVFNRHHIPGNPMKFPSFSLSSSEAATLARSGPTPASPALHSRMERRISIL